MASMDRMAMLVTRVISSGRSRSANGASNIAVSTPNSTQGRMRTRVLPTLNAATEVLRAAARSRRDGAYTNSALFGIDHVCLADDFVAGFTSLHPTNRNVHVHLAMHLAGHHFGWPSWSAVELGGIHCCGNLLATKLA